VTRFPERLRLEKRDLGHAFAHGGGMNLLRLPARVRDGGIYIVVESPRGSAVKLKYDGDFEAFTLSRPLVEGIVYPCDWGFVPSTCAADGDPLDAMVVWDRSTFPGVVLRCRMLGVLGVSNRIVSATRGNETATTGSSPCQSIRLGTAWFNPSMTFQTG
jgi:hypothetical protein